MTNYMDRVMGLLRLPPGRIKRAPKNWRTHEGKQRHVMRGVLNELGVIDAVKVWVPDDAARAALRSAGPDGFQAWAETFTGNVIMFDGHMRDAEIRQVKGVLVTDLDAEEVEKALATFDPVGAMAGKDLDLLKSLLGGVKAKERGTADLLDELLGAPAPLAEPKPDKGPAPGDTGQKAKRVDLMFDDRSYELFLADCDAAMAKLGTRTITETIIVAIRKATQ